MKIFYCLFVTIYWDDGKLFETESWEETYVLGIFTSRKKAKEAQKAAPGKVREYLIDVHKNGPIAYYPHCRHGEGYCVYNGFCTEIIELTTDVACSILREHAVNGGVFNRDDLFPKERPA